MGRAAKSPAERQHRAARSVACVVLSALLVAGAGALGSAGAATAWTVVPSASPAGQPNGELLDVACPTPTSCYAVGGYGAGAVSGAALAEHWNGTTWSIMSMANSAGISLSHIACASDTSCLVIGNTINGVPVIEHWNGAAWSMVSDPVPGVLIGITCASTTACFAVGAGGGTFEDTLVEQWDGTSWSKVVSPSVPGAQANELNDVSCTSPTNCFAVGDAFNAITPRTLIEHWDGSIWSIVASPNPSGGAILMLESVSCPSTTSCFAVGSYESANRPSLIEHWDGTAWSLVASGLSDSGSDVACTSTSNCFALGITTTPKRVTQTHIDHWNGTAWSAGAPLSLTPAGGLIAIACPSATNCFGVGLGPAKNSRVFGIIEHWNGSNWTQVTQPVNPTPTNATLSGVSCRVPSACFGVGRYTNRAGNVVTLIERPVGAAWSLTASPNRAGLRNELSGISCAGASSCFAVGTSGTGVTRTLIERWSGGTWTIVSSASHTHSDSYTNILNGIACASAKSCMAVGTYDDGSFNGTFDTLIERYDGTSWTILPSPNRSQFGFNTLEAVACPAATSCFAVGQTSTDPAGTDRTLIEHWNGTAWSIFASPDTAGRIDDNLTAVSCASAKACVAVGSTSKGTSSESLIESYNGTAWRIVASADPAGATLTGLSGVSCPSPQSCVAVGSDSGSSGPSRTLVKTMTGATWSTTGAANPGGTESSSLAAVSCQVAACVAVGDYESLAAPHSLVERHA